MKIISAEFLTGAVSDKQYPDSECPELAFVGRSNVGKSSLINSLLNRKKLVKTSQTPGKTHYNLWGMIKLAISNILTSSTFPLRMGVYAGVPLLLLNWLVMAINLMTDKSPLPVWLIALNLNFLVMVAVFVAVYLARVYKDGMNKPKFIIDWDNTKLQAWNSKAKFRSLEDVPIQIKN